MRSSLPEVMEGREVTDDCPHRGTSASRTRYPSAFGAERFSISRAHTISNVLIAGGSITASGRCSRQGNNGKNPMRMIIEMRIEMGFNIPSQFFIEREICRLK